MTDVLSLLGSIALNGTFLLLGVLGWRMFTGSPPRLPKIATLLMGVGGIALIPLVTFVVGFITGVIPATVSGFVALVFAVITVVITWDVFNELMPKAGKVAKGSANYTTGLKAAMLPGLTAVTDSFLGGWIFDVFSTIGDSVVQLGSQVG